MLKVTVGMLLLNVPKWVDSLQIITQRNPGLSGGTRTLPDMLVFITDGIMERVISTRDGQIRQLRVLLVFHFSKLKLSSQTDVMAFPKKI